MYFYEWENESDNVIDENVQHENMEKNTTALYDALGVLQVFSLSLQM